jgi:hypothetical protein
MEPGFSINKTAIGFFGDMRLMGVGVWINDAG